MWSFSARACHYLCRLPCCSCFTIFQFLSLRLHHLIQGSNPFKLSLYAGLSAKKKKKKKKKAQDSTNHMVIRAILLLHVPSFTGVTRCPSLLNFACLMVNKRLVFMFYVGKPFARKLKELKVEKLCGELLFEKLACKNCSLISILLQVCNTKRIFFFKTACTKN